MKDRRKKENLPVRSALGFSIGIWVLQRKAEEGSLRRSCEGDACGDICELERLQSAGLVWNGHCGRGGGQGEGGDCGELHFVGLFVVSSLSLNIVFWRLELSWNS